MSTSGAQARVPFTGEDYTARMRRAVADATRAVSIGSSSCGTGAGVAHRLSAHGDHRRLTVLVLTPDREPTLLVPTLERPDAGGGPALRPGHRGLG